MSVLDRERDGPLRTLPDDDDLVGANFDGPRSSGHEEKASKSRPMALSPRGSPEFVERFRQPSAKADGRANQLCPDCPKLAGLRTAESARISGGGGGQRERRPFDLNEMHVGGRLTIRDRIARITASAVPRSICKAVRPDIAGREVRA